LTPCAFTVLREINIDLLNGWDATAPAEAVHQIDVLVAVHARGGWAGRRAQNPASVVLPMERLM
jgi:hypothetical protein